MIVTPYLIGKRLILRWVCGVFGGDDGSGSDFASSKSGFPSSFAVEISRQVP